MDLAVVIGTSVVEALVTGAFGVDLVVAGASVLRVDVGTLE